MGLIETGTGDGAKVHLRRSGRARRMSLRVSAIDGRVTLTLPKRASLGAARAFLADQKDWIASAVAGVEKAVAVEVGTVLPIEGTDHRLVVGAVRTPRIDGGALIVPDKSTGIRVETFLKSLARARLTEEIDRLSDRIARPAGRLTLRDTRSRWGSCSSRGDLMFSWRLIMAPPGVLAYVAAHEVAHLRHMDHSPDFWNLTERLCPGHRVQKDWLRRHGASLHRYRFRGL